MKRFILLVALASVLGLGTAAAGPAEPSGSVKPACADIVGGSTFFSGTVASGGIDLAAPSCRSVRYTMVVYVYDNSTNQVSTILSQTLRSSGASNVHPFSIATPPANYACVYFVTSKGELGDKDTVVLDTAPDSGCPTTLDTSLFNTLAAGSSPGGQGYF